MPPAERRPSLRHALALGLLQGPAELLPVSSSAHTTLLPWLAGWPYASLEGPKRKSFEVSLHAGAALALAARPGSLGAAELLPARVAAGALAPPALVGVLARGPIERRLGGPRSIAAGLAAGSFAMVIAEARARGVASRRGDARDADARDGIALGLAQAAALAPGVSRNGATLSAARARGFERPAAVALSWRAGLPVLLGASALEAARLARGSSREERPAMAAGAAAAFVSTAFSLRVLGPRLREAALLPFAIYRLLLAGLVFLRLGRAQ